MSFLRSHVALAAAILSVAICTLAAADGAPQPRPAARNIADAVPCTACHTTAGWKQAGGGGGGGFDHDATGFPLTGQHSLASCSQCHDGRPVKRACVSCHADAHRGRMARNCDECHSAAGWQVTRALEIHRRTRLPLTGMHALADCGECHKRVGEHQWTTAPIECFACHERDYRRPDLRPLHVGSPTSAPFPRDCSQCHRAMSWAPATFKPGLAVATASSGLEAAPPGHDLRFPISFGAHRSASCSDCHASQASPRSVRCIGCHAHDPVRLAQQHRSPVSAQASSCLGCHPAGARR